MTRATGENPLPEDESQRGGFGWRPKEIWGLLKASGKEFVEDKAPKQAAALAYYAIFAIGPIILILISVLGFFLGDAATRQYLLDQAQTYGGAQAADALRVLIGAGAERAAAGSIVGTVVGVTILLIAAAGVFAQLRESLNRIWEVQLRPVKGMKAKAKRFLRKNLIGFLAILVTGALLLASLVASATLSAISSYAGDLVPGGQLPWIALTLVVTLVLASLMFATLFRFLPDVRISWRDVFIGGTVTGALFIIGQLLIGLYIASGTLANRYGAAGTVVVALVWVYYSSLILFFGAEVTQVYANRYGSRIRPDDDSEPLVDALMRDQREPQREGLTERQRERGRGA